MKVIFNLHRVVVLPVANTWMSWSLLSRLQWTASASVLACLALLSISLLTLGLKVTDPHHPITFLQAHLLRSKAFHKKTFIALRGFHA